MDDEELILVLADTKSKSMDVNEKLHTTAEMRKNINEKREQYRPIATRGSLLYFVIVDLSYINVMYQTSLDQFQLIFDKSIEIAEKSTIQLKRIINIIDTLTYQIYRYINRGIYEVDKISFKLMVAFKILITSHKLSNNDILLFLRGGNGLDLLTIKPKPYQWMTNEAWLNIIQLNGGISSVMSSNSNNSSNISSSQSLSYFSSLIDDIEKNDNLFYSWFNESEPEKLPIPVLESRWIVNYNIINNHNNNTDKNTNNSIISSDEDVLIQFYHMLAVRCFREDRTILAVTDFIRNFEYLYVTHSNSMHISTESKLNSHNSSNSNNLNVLRLPALGNKYIEPITDTVESIYREMDYMTPVIYLLSSGADPTDSIEILARKKRIDIECVSMGEGQDVVALRAINSAIINGSWVLLQNGHLGLEFMHNLEDTFIKLRQPDSNCSNDFRLFITTEPHPKFSIGLLQMSLKVTNEPPKGLSAGLQRSYNVLIDQDKLERIEHSTWRILLYTTCFLHSIIQERRKFGALGWCVPYEFNEGDLNATLMFIEKHLDFNFKMNQNNGNNNTISWNTIQYMTAEVQYGGRITDSIDRRLFLAYTETWLCSTTLFSTFSFNPERVINKIPDNFNYKAPDYLELDQYHEYIQKIPIIDSPELFGLHPNADLTFRFKEVNQLLDTLSSTQPKQINNDKTDNNHEETGKTSSNSINTKTREEIVLIKCQELISSLPNEYIEDEYEERILNVMGGFDMPLNIFLYQEIQRLQGIVITKVKSTLEIVMQGIRGEVVVTAEIMDSIDAIFDGRVPKSWLYSPAGDELSWLSSNLGSWYSSLIQRDLQYRHWLSHTGVNRPHSFWITGFFNAQGFLTAVQQEITRNKKNENWALDNMSIYTEVTDIMSSESIRASAKVTLSSMSVYLCL